MDNASSPGGDAGRPPSAHRSRSGSSGSTIGLLSAVGPEELQEKYTRLAQEYSKVKAQNAVLKKAVVHEQERGTKLDEDVKSLTHELRKAGQEYDILMRHNDRLQKRVESLMEQLDQSSASKAGGGWLSMSSRKDLVKATETLEITNADLEAKIKENEALHGDMHEIRMIAAQNVAALHDQLTDARRRHDALKESSDLAIATKEDELAHAQRRLADVEARLSSAEADLVSTTSALASSQAAFFERDASFSAVSARLKSVVDRRLIVDDTAVDTFNSLNAPHVAAPSKPLIESAERAQSDWRQFSASLRSFMDQFKLRLGLSMQQASTLGGTVARLYEMMSDMGAVVAVDGAVERGVAEMRAGRKNVANQVRNREIWKCDGNCRDNIGVFW